MHMLIEDVGKRGDKTDDNTYGTSRMTHAPRLGPVGGDADAVGAHEDAEGALLVEGPDVGPQLLPHLQRRRAVAPLGERDELALDGAAAPLDLGLVDYGRRRILGGRARLVRLVRPCQWGRVGEQGLHVKSER